MGRGSQNKPIFSDRFAALIRNHQPDFASGDAVRKWILTATRQCADWIFEAWLDIKQLAVLATTSTNRLTMSAAQTTRLALQRFANTTRLRTTIALGNTIAWLHEDWVDIKNLAQLARSATHLFCTRATQATWLALRHFGIAAKIRSAAVLRSSGAWLHEDWVDIKNLAQSARSATCLFCTCAAKATWLALRHFRIAARIRSAAALRNTGAWLHEDWRDVAHCTKYAALSVRTMPTCIPGRARAFWKTGVAAAQCGAAPASGHRPSPNVISARKSRLLGFANAMVGALCRGVATSRSITTRWQNGKLGSYLPRIRGAVDRNRALIRYWRNRAVRYVCSYATDTTGREHLLNVSVSLFGILIAGGGYLAIQNYSESRAQTDFERPAKEVVTFLTETINNHVEVLETARRRFTAKRTPPNRWQFFQSTRDTLKTLPGIQALEWVPRVTHRHRKRYEKRAIKDGLFGFQFVGSDRAHLEQARRDYFPVYYVEPYPGNEGALGFDLATDPVALEALHAARDSGKAVTTTFTPIDLPKSIETADRTAPIVVVVLPVYNTEILPFTPAERRQRITGFIRGVIRLDRMVQAYRSNLSVPPGLEVAFYSHAAGAKPTLRYHNPPLSRGSKPLPYPEKDKSEDINLTAGFNIVDQPWSMVLRPESQLFLRNLSSAAWAFAIFAMLTTAILLLYLLTTQTRTRMIERSVAERTLELEAEIAQRKRIEAELRTAKDEAVEANHAKSEFLAIMSHELRTPLNAITGFSEVMEGEVFGPLGHANYGEYVSFIHDSADHLISLINDILDLSKIEAERYEIHKEEIKLSEAWQPVEDMMAEQIAAAQVSLSNRITDTDCVIRADDRALRQIFLNLLSNAVKFTPEGGRIDVWSEFDPTGRLRISVRDTGIGISEEDLTLVFEPFKQIESKVARKHKGTGLGLPLTQRLVALHGGNVEIESTPGQGTTVCIVLESDSIVGDNQPNKNKKFTNFSVESDAPPSDEQRDNVRAVDAA